MVTVLLVGAGGALGSVARYLTTKYLTNTIGDYFPYGTLVVNIAGSFGMLLFMSYFWKKGNIEYTRFFFAIGFLGGLTTFSSFTSETISLFRDSDYLKMALNLFLNNSLAFLAGLAGFYLGEKIF